MGNDKRFYLGVGGNYGKYNTYGYLLGSLYPETTGYEGYTGKTGYQGSLWNAGLTTGYQLALTQCLALDFNLGLGYTKLEYDSFNIINETRVYNKQDQSKGIFGLTQAGVSLVWRIPTIK